jgi:hypothetical protein
MRVPKVKQYMFRHPLYFNSKPQKLKSRSLDQALTGAIEIIEDELGHVMPRGMPSFTVYEVRR